MSNCWIRKRFVRLLVSNLLVIIKRVLGSSSGHNFLGWLTLSSLSFSIFFFLFFTRLVISVKPDKSFDIFNIIHLSLESFSIFGFLFAKTINTFGVLKFSIRPLYSSDVAHPSLIFSSISYCSVCKYCALGTLKRKISVFVEYSFPTK